MTNSNIPGFCLQNSLSKLLKKDIFIGEWILSDELENLCRQFDLRMLKSREQVRDKDCVVVYNYGNGEGHAEYLKSLRDINWATEVVAVIV